MAFSLLSQRRKLFCPRCMVSIGGPGITALKAAGGGRIKYMYSSQGPEDMFIQPKDNMDIRNTC